VQATLT